MTRKSKSRRFVSTLSYRGSWLTVGGGQKSGIWHVGSGEPAAILDLEGKDSLLFKLIFFEIRPQDNHAVVKF